MVGFEYICRLYDVKPAHVAEKLGVSRQRVHSWVKGGNPVSPKHLPAICEIFPDIPKQYFAVEITEMDKIKIQYHKLAGDCKRQGLTIKQVATACGDATV